MKLIGVDIGGTKIAAGVVLPDGTVLESFETGTPVAGGTEVVQVVGDLIAELGSRHKFEAIGVGTAGVIHPDSYEVVAASSQIRSWAGTDVREALSNRFGVSVLVMNDVHAHGVGEAFVGAGQGYRTLLVVAVGTGIGGAVLQAGLPQLGKHGAAGHVGHVPTAAASGLTCTCGKTGHVEALSSGPGLYELFIRRGGSSSALDARGVVARTVDDEIAYQSVADSARALGEVLGGLANVIDPELIVISGGMQNSGDLWWRSLEEGIQRTAIPLVADVPTVRSKLGEFGAIIGAARFAGLSLRGVS